MVPNNLVAPVKPLRDQPVACDFTGQLPVLACASAKMKSGDIKNICKISWSSSSERNAQMQVLLESFIIIFMSFFVV